jgi:imidazole glycerol-phosphate synthase subunit HisF
VVKPVSFKEPRIVGDSITNVKIFSNRFADEMIIVDIDATRNQSINIELFRKLSRQCIMPLALGGGINSLDKAKVLFEVGADKIVVNSAFYNDSSILTSLSSQYGRQAIVFSLDAKTCSDGTLAVSHCGKLIEPRKAVDVALSATEHGAGEIIINNVDRDGTLGGYDLDLIHSITSAVDVPVIAAGGCGSAQDCIAAIKAGASAVAAGSIFFWVGESIISLKQQIAEAGISVRLK